LLAIRDNDASVPVKMKFSYIVWKSEKIWNEAYVFVGHPCQRMR
jgi:hypothetical protein